MSVSPAPGGAEKVHEKYDRQIRLWGADGQALLQRASLCLINGGATGTETFKNLVLPGIGSFTVVDPHKVTERDLANNFFVTAESIGQPRAKVVTENLKELNELVEGGFVEDTVESILESSPDFFSKFTAVVCTQVPLHIQEKLAKTLWSCKVPLVSVRCSGLLGSIHIVTEQHAIVQTKPDAPVEDLRLANPFPELEEFCDSIDLSKLDAQQFSHVPYVVLIVQALKRWRQEKGSLPSAYAEKKAFREQFKNVQHTTGALPEPPLNFEEAYKKPMSVYAPIPIPGTAREVLESVSPTSLSKDSSTFQIIACAVKEFLAERNVLPLPGTIPDMTSDTATYTKLTHIYQKKAEDDAAAVHIIAGGLLRDVGGAPDRITIEEVRSFCRNVYHIRVQTCEPIDSVHASPALGKLVESGDIHAAMFVVMCACDDFYKGHGHYPGQTTDAMDLDLGELKGLVKERLASLNLAQSAIPSSVVEEAVRSSGCEIHNMAALIGGVVSQEIIKVVTQQFVPLNNLFLFNGATSTSTTIKL